MLIPEARPLDRSLLVNISLLVDLSGLPVTMSAVMGMIRSALPPLSLMLAVIMMAQLVKQLMKRALVMVRKGKSVALVQLPLAELVLYKHHKKSNKNRIIIFNPNLFTLFSSQYFCLLLLIVDFPVLLPLNLFSYRKIAKMLQILR